jgi:hypothetical protein
MEGEEGVRLSIAMWASSTRARGRGFDSLG